MSRIIPNRLPNQKKKEESKSEKQKNTLADVNTSEDDENDSRNKFDHITNVIKECSYED